MADTATFYFEDFAHMHRAVSDITAALGKQQFQVTGSLNPGSAAFEYDISDSAGASVGSLVARNEVVDGKASSGELTLQCSPLKLPIIAPIIDGAIAKWGGYLKPMVIMGM